MSPRGRRGGRSGAGQLRSSFRRSRTTSTPGDGSPPRSAIIIGVKALGRIALAGAIWSALWLVLDLTWGGFIQADFSTTGLQQAYSFILYFVGWVVIGLSSIAWGLKRRFANPS